MKLLQYNLLIILLALALGCQDGYIDDISHVEPGPDEEAPEVTINFPLEGTLIRVKEDVTSIDIDFEVEDDIEIQTISIKLDGSEIAAMTEFKDYRRALEEYTYNNLTNGEHTLTIEATDMAGKTTSKSVDFEKVEPYKAKYDGEVFYLPFDGDYLELLSITSASQVGSPGFADGLVGKAYKGAADSYLTFPTDGLKNEEFSAVFWLKVNATPDRAGILVMGPPDETNPDAQNNRTKGFRLFRENAAGMQRVKLNVGRGEGDSWFDGGASADIDPTIDEWVHIAFTISSTECVVYIDGEVVKQGDFAGVDWTGCDILSIMSGAPRFTGWNHLSDQSLMDELRLFDKALTQQEIQTIIADES